MTTLTIRDLPATETLDRKAMSAVRGGMMRIALPYWGPHHSYASSSFSAEVSQLIGQTQNVVSNNGNNVAFAHDIHSVVKPSQTANNTIRF